MNEDITQHTFKMGDRVKCQEDWGILHRGAQGIIAKVDVFGIQVLWSLPNKRLAWIPWTHLALLPNGLELMLELLP